MSAAVERILELMNDLESENLEFKEARRSYDFGALLKYCAALANEGGGKVILGVTDQRPRRVVGTNAFGRIERTRAGLMEKLQLRIEVEEVMHPNGRILVFTVPQRPVGVPIKADGIYWARLGDSTVPMPEDQLRSIFDEAGHDFSADVCPGASPSDLDPVAVEEFRKRWIAKSGNTLLAQPSWEQLLRDAEVIVDSGVTFAGLILFGTGQALRKHLAQAEVVFEYRSTESAGPAQQRKEYQRAFFSFYDDLWNTINLRNDLQQYQDGLFILDVPTLEERSVREAVLNAVSHRDYRLGASVFIRQYSKRVMIESPGGFPAGISPENVLDRQYPRNRRIADIFAKCGLVERSGQGVNLMFELAIRGGKLPPDFAGTDRYQVSLTLHGQVQDPAFLKFLEKVGRETTASFGTHDLILLDLIHRGQFIPDRLRQRIGQLMDMGVVESAGRGRSIHYLLSRRFYTIIGKKGTYTRRKGLDRQTNKQLLLEHIRKNAKEGSRLEELQQVLPSLSRAAIQWMMHELKAGDLVRVEGRTRGARWYPASREDKR